VFPQKHDKNRAHDPRLGSLVVAQKGGNRLGTVGILGGSDWLGVTVLKARLCVRVAIIDTPIFPLHLYDMMC
jgi:hypothetical protein